MKLDFTWDMDEDDWKLLIQEHKKTKKNKTGVYEEPETYGYCFVGDIRVDIMHTLDPYDCQAYTDVYVLGIDNGYEDFFNGKPYSLIDEGPKVPTACRSFKAFKESFEWRLTEYIKGNDQMITLANKPTGWR